MFRPAGMNVFCYALLPCALFASDILTAGAQAPFVKTTYGVSPAEVTSWVRMHEPLSDAEIAKVNFELFAKGDKKAAWELGLAYMQGLGLPQDLAKAEQMFQIGATSADLMAMVGMFHAQGYFPKDLDAVERWYSAAGRPQDFFELAEEFKRAAQDDKAESRRYYPKATALYLSLLKKAGHPEVRRAQLELGNFVIDEIYSAGSDSKGRAQNLAWARMIAQELLGQKEYQIAVEYNIGQEDLPQDKTMWLRYCKRAAAYNIDLAQHYYVEALTEARTHDFTGYDAVAWLRLSSPNRHEEGALLKAMATGMSPHQAAEADAAYEALLRGREKFGAYYVQDDPMRNPSHAQFESMDQDDPDVQMRLAFDLEVSAATDEQKYQKVLAMYRRVRNERDREAQFVLGRYALYGRNGVEKDRKVAEYWLNEAVRSGSEPARILLATIENQVPGQR